MIKGELNVKNVSFGAAAEEYITYQIKPQLRTLGPKYGKLLGGIRAHLQQANGIEIVSAVKDGGMYSFSVDGQTVELSQDDILVEPLQKEGFVVEVEGSFAVIIDTHLTEELIQEGFVREIISKVQTMRKEAGFEVTDHIVLYATTEGKIMDILRQNASSIAKEVLADDVQYAAVAGGYEKEWNINGEKALLGVKKLS